MVENFRSQGGPGISILFIGCDARFYVECGDPDGLADLNLPICECLCQNGNHGIC